ncbi:hypothetical protein OIHEL45_05635 [Sulfitobacter indolifex HEL-45]|uniref:Uncharacterized protein n=1 Tax=Sulfitobacter indolifex HEL-45 TaxID=391624 RepID=A0ABM9X9N9_9RHOB|nr:hypothetical protein OIHEL45_05635 [Sulfitobacter indolifex HEL-45]
MLQIAAFAALIAEETAKVDGIPQYAVGSARENAAI